MEILSELPHEIRKYPTLKLVDGKVLLKIGRTCMGWRLKPGEKVRFNRHGTFQVDSTTKVVAFLTVRFPRKGWNPAGIKVCTVAVPARCEISIRKGAIHLRRLPLVEWKKIQADEQHWREYQERMRRRFSGTRISAD